ncbi:Cecropin-P2 [Toxocara canis]|uniref:Cecropin-P2 n=1 Tax=Toxocara canis TaxID=6265 RepID=A0A0B2VKJ5_TOXCA|nr:Cecropin-P2 [Toxocara canis]
MFAVRRTLLFLVVLYLLTEPIQGSWLSKTYKKLENSTKKRIAEGIAIAIKGGPRRRRFVPDVQDVRSLTDAHSLLSAKLKLFTE